MENLNKTIMTTHSGRIKGLSVEIKKWKSDNMEKEIYNTYILIKRQNLGEDFKKILCRAKKYNLGSKDRYTFDYHKIEGYFNLSGGATFYEKLYDERGKVFAIRIGNDYNHIWNGGETLESIYEELEESIDKFITSFPNYLVWSGKDGNYEKYDKLNHYHN